MQTAPIVNVMEGEQNQQLSETIRLERVRLRNFIRKRVPDLSDAEDILQDVFYELIEAFRLMKPIEHVGAWLYRVARNRITDQYRKRKTASLADTAVSTQAGDEFSWEDLLPSAADGPEGLYTRTVLLEEMAAALNELPAEQRDIFMAHEVEGESFQEISDRTGTPVNTLLSRKRYAVRHLRRRLQAIYDEFIGTERQR
jgi:RNA polymerase sigma factor (sigma-70 family)